MSSPNVTELYQAYDIINKKDEKLENKANAYKKIMLGAGGDEKERRLASQFIVNFFDTFPDLHEEAFNKLLDLGEEDNIVIRKQVIQLLPTIAKKVVEYQPKVADTLIQMLQTEDLTEIAVINKSLDTVLNLNMKSGLEAIFSQLISQLEETTDIVNTFAFKYLADKFSSLATIETEIDNLVDASCTKLLGKLEGREEFSYIVNVLSHLKSYTTIVGRQKLINQLGIKARSLNPINDKDKFSILVQYGNEAAKLMSINVQADDLIMLIMENLPIVSKLDLKDCKYKMNDLMKLLVDLANRGKNMEANTQISKLSFTDEKSKKYLTSLFDIFHNKLPEVPKDVTEEEINKWSTNIDWLNELESSLLAIHFLCKYHQLPVIQSEKHRPQLQYLGRIAQVATKNANEALNKLTRAQKALDDFKDVVDQPRMTSNLQLLIREMFKTPPSFKSIITPSWVPTAPETSPIKQTVKRTSNDVDGVPTKFPNRQNNRRQNFGRFRRRR